MVTITNCVIDRAELGCMGPPWHFEDFRKIFFRNIGEDKKILTICELGPWHCALWKNCPWLLLYVHKKVR